MAMIGGRCSAGVEGRGRCSNGLPRRHENDLRKLARAVTEHRARALQHDPLEQHDGSAAATLRRWRASSRSPKRRRGRNSDADDGLAWFRDGRRQLA